MIPAVGCSRQSAQHPREAGVLALDVRENNSIPGPSAMNARLSLARRRADRAADSVIDAGLGQQNKMEWNCQNLPRWSIPQRIDGFIGLRLCYRRGGVETGSHWHCYYRALKKGGISRFLGFGFLKATIRPCKHVNLLSSGKKGSLHVEIEKVIWIRALRDG
jgi:hypothetical protein